MFAKCDCMYCQGPIEFDLTEFVPGGETATERTGQKVTCPHCGKETILSVKKKKVAFNARPEFIHPADAAAGKTHWLTIAFGTGIIITLIIVLAFAIHTNPGMLGAIGQGGVDIIAALITCTIAILGIVLAVFWLIFPWMVYSLLKQIELNTRPRREAAPADEAP